MKRLCFASLYNNRFVAQDSFEMSVIIPPFLKSGDKVAIVATARWITEDQLQPALDLFNEWGLQVVTGKNLHKKNFQLAGSDLERAIDLQEMLDNPEIRAIVIARGGYGTIRMLDQLDFSGFMKSPKWICGYSDITVLHAKLAQLNVASIHSTMPISFPDATSKALQNLKESLFGTLSEISFSSDFNSAEQVKIQAPVRGGNLSVLYSLLGSEELKTKTDYVLFVEDVDEMLYHIDRMFMGLKRSGFFHKVKAICVGGFTQMKDNTDQYGFSVQNPWGHSAEETVMRFAKELAIPVFFGFPAGHMSDNRAFYFGIPTTLEMSSGLAVMKFQHK